jgi:aminopeptidase YwaD
MKKSLLVLIAWGLISLASVAHAQTGTLLADGFFQAIRAESSGERPLKHFHEIHDQFSGFSPSKGGDQIAEFLAARAREFGLSDVTVEGFPADGKTFFWAFLTEPAWEGESGTLTMIEPTIDRLADFSADRIVVGRFSSSADVTAELVDVGAGTSAADYERKDVRGKIVMASGTPGTVQAEAVWGRGAVGILWYLDNAGYPSLIRHTALAPWTGPRGESTAFLFSIPYTKAFELRQMLGNGERIRLRASVKATMGPGEYKLVNAVIPGSDRSLPEVYVWAHDNYRNSGGANNLSGVGATLEMARVLNTLIAQGKLPQPRRSIRFCWGAEHYASTYNFFKDPAERHRVLAMLNVDMTGFHQERAKSVFRLYRTPYSRPHFVNDVAEDFMRSVGRANSTSLPARDSGPYGMADPTLAPSGSRDQLHYAVEEFWGPSDHEDVGDGALGIAAVMYNDWPDPFLSTQSDDITLIDPTQMRRSVLTVASTAYYLATVSPDAIVALAPVVLGYAQARMASEARRASVLMAGGDAAALNRQYSEALNILRQSTARERTELSSLQTLGDTPAARAAVARALKQVDALQAANLAAFEELAGALATERRVTLAPASPTAAERQLNSLIPRRNENVRGTLHAEWLHEKTGEANFHQRVALYRRGEYVPFEALNFVNGTRTLGEIRDAISAEYGPIDILELEEFFRFLEKAGVVSMPPRHGSSR